MRRISADSGSAGGLPVRTRGGLAAGLAAAALSLWLGSAPAQDAALAEAETVIARLHTAIVEAARLEDREARIDLLRPVVRDTHDLGFIAELTIRRQWRELDEASREAFVAAFETLSVTTYATRFAGAGPDTFRTTGSGATEDGRIEVRAEIVRAQDPSVPLDYLLQDGDAGWRIVNIVADGVSDLALKRARYQQVFRDGGGIDDLIGLLTAETEAL